MRPRVLISDDLSQASADRLVAAGCDVTLMPALGKIGRIADTIGAFDGLIIRSATQVTKDVLARGTRLQVVGRAGIGVDNVDIPAATAHGITVMNTPLANAVTTAEHTIAMIMAVVRQIPTADAATRSGIWEKTRFKGMELRGKTLGIIGCGNIGSIVADLATGLKLRVIAFDPALTIKRAEEIGVERVSLGALLGRSDIITLHTQLTPATRHIINAAALRSTRPGVHIINCARGGLIDEAALAAAIRDGHVRGAALDVFEEEPCTANVLFGLPNVVCTPHIGASTLEAQERVGDQIADQVAAFLLGGAAQHAINAVGRRQLQPNPVVILDEKVQPAHAGTSIHARWAA